MLVDDRGNPIRPVEHTAEEMLRLSAELAAVVSICWSVWRASGPIGGLMFILGAAILFYALERRRRSC
jgi:hypothetical protein